MKAIQVKYLGATNTKPSRLKVWAEGSGSVTESLSYDLNCDQQALQMAQQYAITHGWPEVKGFGSLPNGDYVATMQTVSTQQD